MSFKITVTEIKEPSASFNPGESENQIYVQTVPQLDMGKLIAAVNYTPRVRKTKTATAKAAV